MCFFGFSLTFGNKNKKAKKLSKITGSFDIEYDINGIHDPCISIIKVLHITILRFFGLLLED